MLEDHRLHDDLGHAIAKALALARHATDQESAPASTGARVEYSLRQSVALGLAVGLT
jgi:hypothetical protein